MTSSLIVLVGNDTRRYPYITTSFLCSLPATGVIYARGTLVVGTSHVIVLSSSIVL